MAHSSAFETSLEQCRKATDVGNRIAIRMLELIGTSKHQPHAFEGLAIDFLQLCRVMWAIDAGMTQCQRNQQQIPADVVQELCRKFKATNNDFRLLDEIVSRFLEYERRGTMGKIQRGWRKMFSEDEIRKMQESLRITRDTMKMSALMFEWSVGSDKIDEAVGIGYTGLAAALDRLAGGTSGVAISHTKSLQRGTSEKEPHVSLTYDPLPPLPMVAALDKLSISDHGRDLDVRSSANSHLASQVPLSSSPHAVTPSDRLRRHTSLSNGTMSCHSNVAEPMHSPSRVRETTIPNGSDRGLTESETTLFGDDELFDSGPIKVVRVKPDPSSMPRWTPRNGTLTQSPQHKTSLISAVQTGNSSMVEQLLDRGVSPNTGPDISVLNEAMAHHDLESARQLLMFGGDANLPDARGLTPLMSAVEHSFLDGATLLLKYGAVPDPVVGSESESPLVYTIDENRFNLTRLLLMYGADANHVICNGQTLLIRAVSRKLNQRVISLLLSYGADPNKKARDGVSPLFLAVSSGRADIVSSLLDHGANPNLPGPKHLLWPAIHQIPCLKVILARGADYKKAPGIMEQSASTNNIEAIRILLDAGVDPNAKKDGIYTPLCTSIRDDRKDIFHLLLSKGADPNVPASEYPAFKCVTHFRLHFLPFLVEAGVDLRSPGGILETAVSSNNMEALKWLLEAGVPPNDKCPKSGATALTTAIRENRMEYIELLLAEGANPNVRGEDWPVFMAVHQPEILKKVLPRLKHPRAYKGVMERAVVANQLESIKLLLAAGVSVEDRNGGVFSPLTSAIRDRQKAIVRFLIDEAGADVNAPGEHLPIVKALRRYEGDDHEIIKMLLEKGADPNKVYRGHSGIFQAVENGDAKVLKLLVDHCGIDFTAKDEAGQTVLQVAESRGWEEGKEILQRVRKPSPVRAVR